MSIAIRDADLDDPADAAAILDPLGGAPPWFLTEVLAEGERPA
jgi:hypothetical protein